jgi:hypothetical protein
VSAPSNPRVICARYAELDRRRRAVRVGERRRWQWILLLTGSFEEVYELTPAQSRKDGLYGSGSAAVHHHNVESWAEPKTGSMSTSSRMSKTAMMV